MKTRTNAQGQSWNLCNLILRPNRREDRIQDIENLARIMGREASRDSRSEEKMKKTKKTG